MAKKQAKKSSAKTRKKPTKEKAKKTKKLKVDVDIAKMKKRLKQLQKLFEKHPSPKVEKVSTYVEGFDELLHGGLVVNSNVLLAGPPGSGKTILALEYCYKSAQNGEPSLFISTNEPLDRLKYHAKAFGWDIDKEKNMHMAFYTPYEMKEVINSEGLSLRDFVDDLGIKKVAFDSLSSVAISFKDRQEENDFTYAFFDAFNKMGVTALFTLEKSQLHEYSRWEFMADGIVHLHNFMKEDVRVRGIEVVKMRDTSFVEQMVPYLITLEGIKIFPNSVVFV